MTDFQFQNYSAERLKTESIESRLNPKERDFRKRLMDYVIRNNRPYNVYDLNDETAEVISDIQLIENLVEARAAVLDNQGNTMCIYPLSAIETPHIVKLADNQWFYAMSAVDALGSGFAFNQDCTITSQCSSCHEKISVTIQDNAIAGAAPEGIYVLHVDFKQISNRSGSACRLMNFFCDQDHYNQWVLHAGVKEERVFCLDLNEAFEVARMIYQVE